MTDSIKLTREAEIAWVALNRPQAFNAFDRDLAEAFAAQLSSLAVDPEVRAVVISGEGGKAFCAGGDLKYFLGSPHGPARTIHEVAGYFHQAVIEIRRMAKPVIAAINGVAAGGGFSLALACDFRVMGEAATPKQAYTSAGLSLDGGGSFTLPRIVGLARALEIIAFDQPISAPQALAWGLATKVVPDAQVLTEAMSMARELAGRSLNSFGWAKRLLTDSFDSAFEAHLERERRGLATCAAHADGQEGLKAFVEKRKPVFMK
ncbi:MAG: enoyl-CoA hydratase-related protein [Deltaproteobacteria bacterium]|nr:enoyl-CoA hydratase-related protein [Deltaproteobacteria bacterium]